MTRPKAAGLRAALSPPGRSLPVPAGQRDLLVQDRRFRHTRRELHLGVAPPDLWGGCSRAADSPQGRRGEVHDLRKDDVRDYIALERDVDRVQQLI